VLLACERLLVAGFTNVVNIAGGTAACEAARLPIVRDQGTMSLERQVRIAAGSRVFVGSALAWFVHLYWLALPAFVGAGLIFAGITDALLTPLFYLTAAFLDCIQNECSVRHHERMEGSGVMPDPSLRSE
jgi:hypothetical protein